jgi:hypothetical protein
LSVTVPHSGDKNTDERYGLDEGYDVVCEEDLSVYEEVLGCQEAFFDCVLEAVVGDFHGRGEL